VEIRDGSDTLIAQQTLTTNRFGSYNSEFQLAPEPSLGNWQIVTIIDKERYYSSFEVQAYRKPEFTVTSDFEKTHSVAGSTVALTLEAKYFFGQPVAGAKAQYSVTGAETFNATGVTDAKGKLRIEIPTHRSSRGDQDLSVSATVTDLSRRAIQASATTTITQGMYKIFIWADKGQYLPDQTAIVNATATDYDDKPVSANIRITMSEQLEDSKHRSYVQKTSRDIVTDKKGLGHTSFKLTRPGGYSLDAESYDSDNNKIVSSSGINVVKKIDQPESAWPTLEIQDSRDSNSYRPGETASLRIVNDLVATSSDKTDSKSKATRYGTVWALVTVEGEHLYNEQVVPLKSHVTPLRIPLTDREFPSVSVNVAVIQERRIYEQNIRLKVLKGNQKLNIDVTSDKEKYLPGETATYTISTRDYKGRPAPAEVSLGVVDESIYEIAPDSTPDPFSFFYGDQDIAVTSDFSFAAQYSGGAFQTMAVYDTVSGDGGLFHHTPAIRVRRQFADTAYWNPSVVTGSDGIGTLTFTLPDNLTTWRATARAISANTDAGQTTQKVLVSMPLQVRLELPRFYVQGDEAVVSAIVRNDSGAERSVKTHIETQGMTLDGNADGSVDLASGDQKRIDWRAKIVSDKTVLAHITADGGEGAQDAVELTLPSQQDGMKMVDVRTETLSESSRYEQNLDNLTPNSNLTLTLSPSVGVSVFDAIDYLTSYPYGCAEQTMSSFLPDVFVERALSKLNVPHKVNPKLNQWVSIGLQKLYRYQHTDGGWQWWEFDQTDGDMTAYVLWGLIQAKDAGYLVDQRRIDRGAEALLRLLKQEQDLSRRADWLLPLAYARPNDVASDLSALYEKRDKLDTYGKASLALALAQAGGKLAPLAQTAASEIDNSATIQGRLAHWSSSENEYLWRDEDVTVTAHALLAIEKIRPTSANITPAVRWLLQRRCGQAWSSTRASAEVVYALSDYMGTTGELNPSFTETVRLDGDIIKKQDITPSDVFNTPLNITLTPDQLKGKHMLTIDREGSGALYVTQTNNYIVPAAQATPVSKGLTVKKRFTVTAADPFHADTQVVGDFIDVTLRIDADANYQYVMVEDPIPAGCEVMDEDDDNQSYRLSGDWYGGDSPYRSFVRREVRDNRVVFFVSYMQKGPVYINYRLYAQTPGIYRILPTQAYLTYFPEISGTSGFARSKIVDEEQKP